ncbi:MAG: NAD-dependent epimerase/dehydratase family protein [Bacteroidales bacterium]|nr:NAD-dependent epimerase/dehydratase family protein [Bacteroidales bacterium]MCF8334006.1 NAD-dependent epimerase/dehydratase family protein [Bacteroidales bacterium]
MKKILVLGACGQIGSELVVELRNRYGNNNVVASDLCEDADEKIAGEGPFYQADVTDAQQIAKIVRENQIDTIYNLAAILSAMAEQKPHAAWNVGINGLYNVLEIAREQNCSVFFPSSIGAFGPTTPPDSTPQDTIQRPQTMYGVTKVTGELLSDYYHKRFGVDTRGVRFPGIISNVTLPGGGTTDYAVEIYYEAVKSNSYISPLKKGTFLDMMYMPDAVKAAIELMEAEPSKLKHRNCFNITAMSIDPEAIANSIRKFSPGFELKYDPEEVKQEIADSWPNSLDDSAAREEWGWKPDFKLDDMTEDMLKAVKKKYEKNLI